MKNEYNKPIGYLEFCWLTVPIYLIFFSIIYFILIPHLTPSVNVEEMLKYTLKQLPDTCLPEPLEHNRYIGGVVFLFIFYFSVGYYSSKIITYLNRINIHRGLIYFIISFTQACLVIFIIVNWWRQSDAGYIYFTNAILTSLLSILVFLLFFYFNIELYFKKFKIFKIVKFCLISISVYFIILGLLPAVFTDLNIRFSSITVQYHLPFTMEEFSSVLYGHTPLVDFFPQYQNLLPILAYPYFKFFGINITTFTILMACLSGITLVFSYLILIRFTGSVISGSLLFLPFLAACFFPINPFLDGFIERNYFFNYYAFSPLRTFGPWLVFYFFSKFLFDRTRKNMIFLFIFSTMSLINNAEFGLASLAASIVSVFLSSEKKIIPSKDLFLEYLKIIILCISGCFSIFMIFIFFKSGNFPDFSSWLSFQLVFAKLGFAMLPMKSFGIHLYIFLTFGVCVMWGLLGLANPTLYSFNDFKIRKNRLAIILFSGILGFGVSVYFVGRSHPWVLPSLFGFWMFSISLLLWEIYILWRDSISTLNFRRKLIYLIPTNLLIFTFCIFVFRLSDYVPLENQFFRFSSVNNELIETKHLLAKYIKNNNQEKYPIMVIFPYGHQITNESGFYNEYPFSHQYSLLLKVHLEKVCQAIVLKKVRKIFGAIPNDLKDKLIELGFKEKHPFIIQSALLPMIQMKTFSFWEK